MKSSRLETIVTAIVFAIAIVVVLLDLFVWRVTA